MADDADTDILELTAQIVSAHVGNSQVTADVLPEPIQSVYHSLAKAGTSNPALALRAPAAPIRKSIFPGHIVCLEDGQKLKTLKRHLQASHGMTLVEYRQKWELPASYPMVAPNYASFRSSLAKKTGLGHRLESPQPTNLAETTQEPDPQAELPGNTRTRAARGVQMLKLHRLSVVTSDELKPLKV